jgi:hypothetical protein
LIAVAEDGEWLLEIGADEIHEAEARLILGFKPVFADIGDIEQIDRPVVGFAAELIEIAFRLILSSSRA